MAGYRKAEGVEEITWGGRKYRRLPGHKDRHRRVYYMATTSPRTYLHQDIYEDRHGPIPDGFHIHHINHDPLDNRVENLAALSPEAHAVLHGQEASRIIRTCAECGEQFSAVRYRAKWCSPACKERNRRRAGTAYVRPKVEPMAESRNCEECGAEFIARRPWARFCTSLCRGRAGRRARASLEHQRGRTP